MPFPQIADGGVSKDKGGVVMNWERSGGVMGRQTSLLGSTGIMDERTRGVMVDDVKKRANWGESGPC